MQYTDNEMSTILLCSRVGIGKEDPLKTLTLGEWNRFVDRLVENKIEPKIVMTNCNELKQIGYDQAECDRFARLADRGAAAAMTLDEYEQRGIYVSTMLSPGYPVMLKRVLGAKKPPVLFFAGDLSLAGKVGIGVVGSRNLSADGLEFIEKLVGKAVGEKLMVYSGGARGADQTAEIVSLLKGGSVVEYLADSLTSKIKKKDISGHITDGKMLVFSDMLPTAGFTAARAMNRNKYIYASAYGTFVSESDYNKGGTWTGAKEAMRHNWGKVYVWSGSSKEGNRKLIEDGARPFDFEAASLVNLLMESSNLSDSAETVYTHGSEHIRMEEVCESSSSYQQLSLFENDKLSGHK